MMVCANANGASREPLTGSASCPGQGQRASAVVSIGEGLAQLGFACGGWVTGQSAQVVTECIFDELRCRMAWLTHAQAEWGCRPPG